MWIPVPNLDVVLKILLLFSISGSTQSPTTDLFHGIRHNGFKPRKTRRIREPITQTITVRV